jgi:hypothetical protein
MRTATRRREIFDWVKRRSAPVSAADIQKRFACSSAHAYRICGEMLNDRDEFEVCIIGRERNFRGRK